MKDHYSLKKQWQLTVESWNKSKKDSKKSKLIESCENKKNKVKKKVKEEVASAGGATTTGAGSAVGETDPKAGVGSGPDRCPNAKLGKLQKRKLPELMNKMKEADGDYQEPDLTPDEEQYILKLADDPRKNHEELIDFLMNKGYRTSDIEQFLRMALRRAGQLDRGTPESEFDPEDVEARKGEKELNDFYSMYPMESVRRTLNNAFNKALFSESIAVQEEDDEDMGMEDEISDVDSDPDMGDEDQMGGEMGGEEIPLGNEPEEMLSDEPPAEEIPDGSSDVQGRLDKIENMLQQLLDIESSEGESIPEIPPVEDIEGGFGSDTIEEPIGDEMGMEMGADQIEDPSLETEIPPLEGEEDADGEIPESNMREGVMSEIDIISREALEMLGKNASEMPESKLQMFVKQQNPDVPDNWMKLIVQRIKELSYGDEDIGFESRNDNSWKKSFYENTKNLRLPIIESLLRGE